METSDGRLENSFTFMDRLERRAEQVEGSLSRVGWGKCNCEELSFLFLSEIGLAFRASFC